MNWYSVYVCMCVYTWPGWNHDNVELPLFSVGSCERRLWPMGWHKGCREHRLHANDLVAIWHDLCCPWWTRHESWYCEHILCHPVYFLSVLWSCGWCCILSQYRYTCCARDWLSQMLTILTFVDTADWIDVRMVHISFCHVWMRLCYKSPLVTVACSLFRACVNVSMWCVW